MINAAYIDAQRIVTNVIVVDSLNEAPGTVECPWWVGIGMSIDTPQPPPPPPPVPQSVTPRQARLALLQDGYLNQVDAAVQNAGRDTQIAWNYAISIERNSPLTASIGAAVGLTDSQIDDLFILAATL